LRVLDFKGVPPLLTELTEDFDDEGLLWITTLDESKSRHRIHILIGFTSHDEDCQKRYVIATQRKSLMSRFTQTFKRSAAAQAVACETASAWHFSSEEVINSL
jgi:hypothetical protein